MDRKCLLSITFDLGVQPGPIAVAPDNRIEHILNRNVLKIDVNRPWGSGRGIGGIADRGRATFGLHTPPDLKLVEPPANFRHLE